MEVLEAVNIILASIGDPPVTELDTDGVSTQAEAEAYLYRYSREVQGDGWHCNTEIITYTPNMLDQVQLGTDVLSARTTANSASRNVAIRDNYVYDRDTNSFTITADIELQVIKLLDFPVLPTKLAYYIATIAAVEFQRYIKRGPFDDAMNRSRVDMAAIDARREDGEQSGRNMLNTAHAQRIRGRRARGAPLL